MTALHSLAAPVASVPARLQRVPCNLCGAWEEALLYPGTLDVQAEQLDPQQAFACTSSLYGRYGPVVRCRRCGLVYLNPRLAAESVETAYEEVEDTRYAEEREGRVHTFARALDELERVGLVTLQGHAAERSQDGALRVERGGRIPPAVAAAGGPDTEASPAAARGRLLDVGCHIGVFLELALARGWAAEGVEPSRWASAYARARGLNVACGTLRGCAFPSAAFDVVTLWDVVEHFTDPAAELREVHRLLRPDGLVCMTTMNIESLVARLLGPRWPWLMQMHLYYFSVRTLSAMLERCGFRVVAVTPHCRIVRLSYLLSRAERWLPGLARALQAGARRIHLADWLVSVDLGDIFTLYAQRVDAPNGRHNGHPALERAHG